MRITTTLECVGKNFQEIVDSLSRQWVQLSGSSDTKMPNDAEIMVEKSDKDSQYTATCVIRTKIEP